jgi:hypothetical protein
VHLSGQRTIQCPESTNPASKHRPHKSPPPTHFLSFLRPFLCDLRAPISVSSVLKTLFSFRPAPPPPIASPPVPRRQILVHRHRLIPRLRMDQRPQHRSLNRPPMPRAKSRPLFRLADTRNPSAPAPRNRLIRPTPLHLFFLARRTPKFPRSGPDPVGPSPHCRGVKALLCLPKTKKPGNQPRPATLLYAAQYTTYSSNVKGTLASPSFYFSSPTTPPYVPIWQSAFKQLLHPHQKFHLSFA